MDQFRGYINRGGTYANRGSNSNRNQQQGQYHPKQQNTNDFHSYVNPDARQLGGYVNQNQNVGHSSNRIVASSSSSSLDYHQTDRNINMNQIKGYSQDNINQFGGFIHQNPKYVQQDTNQSVGYVQDNTNQLYGYPNQFEENPNQFGENPDQFRGYLQYNPNQFEGHAQLNIVSTKVKDNPDEMFINEFISKINKQPAANKIFKQKTDSSKNVTSIKSQLKRCFEILEKLESTRNELQEKIDTISSEDWNAKTSKISSLSSELTTLTSHFIDVKQLRRKIQKRARKRALRHERLNLEKREVLEENLRKHEEIDRWLENMRDNVERVKAEENMKKDADCVLAEVTKKKSEGKKQINLVEALIKLREVREKAAVNRGERLCSEDSVAFEKTCDKLKTIWDKSMGVYAKEEQGLRIMLEEGDEQERKKRKQSGKEGMILKKWENVLFGDDPKSGGALYWGLTQAERDFGTFVAIRESWDTFLRDDRDDHATAIPVGWILPNNNPNDVWKQFLKS